MITKKALTDWKKIQIHCAVCPYPLDYLNRGNANDGYPVDLSKYPLTDAQLSDVLYQSNTYRDVTTDVLHSLVWQSDLKIQLGTWLAAACHTVGGMLMRHSDMLIIDGKAEHPWNPRVQTGPLCLDPILKLANEYSIDKNSVTAVRVRDTALEVAAEFFSKKLILIHYVPEKKPAPNTVWHELPDFS